MLHRCRACECPHHVRSDYLMCFKHWELVPHELKRQVNRAWRRRDMRAWRKACSKAIYAVGMAEGIYDQLKPGVYVHKQKRRLEVDVPELLDELGVEDTEENRDIALAETMRLFREKCPDLPQVATRAAEGA